MPRPARYTSISVNRKILDMIRFLKEKHCNFDATVTEVLECGLLYLIEKGIEAKIDIVRKNRMNEIKDEMTKE